MTSPGRAQDASSPFLDYDTVDAIPFRELPPKTWSREFHRANVLIDTAVADRCAEVLAALGIPLGLDDDETARRAEVAPERRYAFDWMLRMLELEGRVERGAAGEILSIEGTRPPAGPPDDLTRQVTEELEPALSLIGEAAAVYPDFLRGAVDGLSFFRRPDVLALWRRFFRNDNLAYGPVNEVAAFAVETRVVAEGLRVLELGAGLGSAAEALLERCGSRIASYTFTDQLPPFLKWGRQHLEERFPDAPCAFRMVDFDRPLAEQGIPAGGHDVCYAVNALHAARDLLKTLREVRSVLAPGGTLVVGEAFRPRRGQPVSIEFVFQLSEDFQRFEPEPDFRPVGGFLHHRDWFVALERAGFTNVRTVPDVDATLRVYPAHSMGAVLAERGPASEDPEPAG